MKNLPLILFFLASGWCAYGQAPVADKNAADLVRYANSVIALSNNYYEHLNTHQNNLSDLMDYRDLYDYKPEIRLKHECNDPLKTDSSLYATAMNPTDDFGESDVIYINNSIEQYKTGIENLDEQCAQIENQLRGEKFKLDDFNDLDSLILASDEIVNKLIELHKGLVAKILDPAKKAEEQIQSDNPLGPLINPMKSDLSLANQLLFKIGNLPNSDFTSIKMEALRLRGGLAKSRALKNLYKKEVKKNQLEHFDQFYDLLESGFLKLSDDIIEKVSKSTSKNKYDDLKEDQQKLIATYNRLVAYFNQLGLHSIR